MREVHLLDPEAPDGGPATLRAAAGCGGEVAALVLGGAAAERRAIEAGCAGYGTIAMPGGIPLAAVPGLRAWARGAGPTAAVAWSARSAAVARAAGLPLRAVVAGRAPDRGVRELLRRRPVELLLATHAGAAAGWSGLAGRIEPIALPAGPVGAQRAAPGRRELREAWGVPEEALLVAAPADPASALDARAVVRIVSRVAVLRPPIMVLLAPDCRELGAAVAWLRRLRLSSDLVCDDRAIEPWRVAAALDLAIAGFGAPDEAVDAPWRGLLAAGVPAVVADRPLLRERAGLGDDAAALIAADPNHAAMLVAQLAADPARRAPLRAAARRRFARGADPASLAQRLRAALDATAAA